MNQHQVSRAAAMPSVRPQPGQQPPPVRRSRAATAPLTALVLGLLLVAGSAAVHAELTIRITGGAEAAQPIAIVPFGVGAAGPPPTQPHEIIAADLASTGRFAPLARRQLPSLPSTPGQVNFAEWRQTGAPHLIIGSIDRFAASTGEPRYRIDFRVFDVLDARQLAGFRVETDNARLRRTAHQLADRAYEAITGEPGAFDTRIAYVTETGSGDNRRYGLVVADSDGFNPVTVYRSGLPIMSPHWAPDARRLAFVSYETERPRALVLDVFSGQREVLTQFPRLNSGPVWAPDGRRVAMTLSKDGNPEIYVVDVATKRATRLTRNGAIDTEAAWSPDGRSIAFTSNRGGGPQVYRMSSSGGSATRLTFEGSYNSRPRFSPDGGSIAFVHRDAAGAFRIATLDLASGEMRVLSDGTLDESPSFAPNGSVVLYATSARGTGVLASVSVDGAVRRELSEQRGKVREPAWSPLLPR